MLRNTKTKILSLLVTICMLTSTFIVPMTASAANAPGYPVSSSPSTIQVVSSDFKTFPAAAGTTASNPKLVFVVTATPAATFNASTAFTSTISVMDVNFTYVLADSTITSQVGTYDAVSGTYSGGAVFYAKALDTNNAGTYFYYKVVAFSPPSSAATLTSITDADDLANSGVAPGVGGNDAAGATAVAANLKDGKVSFPQTAILKGEATSAMTVWTNDTCSTAAPASLTAGVYYIKVVAQDGTTAKFWKLTVSNASSTDTKLNLTPKRAIISGNSSTVSDLGVIAAATSYINLPAGSYTISNLNGELFAKNDAAETITSVTTKLNAAANATVAAFTQVITSGDVFKIDILVTPASGLPATHTIIYRVYSKGIFSVSSGMPAGVTCSAAQFLNDNTNITAATGANYAGATTPFTLTLTLPVGVSTISTLSSAFNYYGVAIEFASANTFAADKIITSVTTDLAGTTIFARVRTNDFNDGSGNPQAGTYIFYSIAISRSSDASVMIKKATGSIATITDGNNVSIDNADTIKYNGKFDTSITSGDGLLSPDASTTANAFTIKLTVNLPAKLKIILANLAITSAGAVRTPSYFTDSAFTNAILGVDPYLAFGDIATVYVKASSENSTAKYFKVIVSVVANSTNAAISSINTALGTSTIVAGNLDPSTPSALAITSSNALTAINASAFTAAEYGVFRLFANLADITDNTKAVSTIAIASNVNSAIAYASVTSGNGNVVRYFKIVVNKVDATTQYQISTPGFVKVGSNQIATVTVDRALAAKLNAPKVFVIYTLADGETMVYQTLDLVVSDTTATTQIVCGAGFSHVQACVIDGNLDWTVGIPDVMSAQFIDLDVPAIG